MFLWWSCSRCWVRQIQQCLTLSAETLSLSVKAAFPTWRVLALQLRARGCSIQRFVPWKVIHVQAPNCACYSEMTDGVWDELEIFDLRVEIAMQISSSNCLGINMHLHLNMSPKNRKKLNKYFLYLIILLSKEIHTWYRRKYCIVRRLYFIISQPVIQRLFV